MLNVSLSLIALALGTGLSSSTSVSAQTLLEALASAYNSNPGIMAQRTDLKSTDESVPQAMGNWRPKIELSGDFERTYTKNNTRTTSGEKNQLRSPRNTTVTVTQPLFRGFRTVVGVKQAEIGVLSKRAALIGSEQDLLLNAATQYLTVRQNEAVLELNKKNEVVLRRQLEATQDRFRVGEITRTDVSQAQARLAGAIATRIKSEGDLKIAKAGYFNVIGAPSGKLAAPGSLPDLPKSLQSAKELALSEHPDVVAASLNSQTAQEGIKAKKGELYPTLNMVGTFKRDWESINNDSDVTTGQIKLDLTIPLYQKGTVYSGLRKAKVDAAKSRLDLESARRSVSESVDNAWESLQSARARIQSFGAQIRAAEIALEGVQREASVGSRTVLDVLDAEQELVDAKVSLVGAQRDEVVASFQLKEATGQLTAQKLGLAVEIFDPAANYKKVRNKLLD
ncbi:MAG: TolC family outer membrane protein [Pseudomonadota bacterium]|nr:TolC family outer membrane protein [Pseudomonadota bacterium]